MSVTATPNPNLVSDRFTNLEVVLYSPPDPRVLVIKAETQGVDTGIIIRVMVARASRGESNAQLFRYELGIPRFSQNDAPRWDARNLPPGEYRVKAEAKFGSEWKDTLRV